METAKAKTILVIDDDPEFVAALSTFLTGHGYHVHKAYDATVGIQHARKKEIDLMTLDLGLPAGGGLFVLKSVRKLGKVVDLPIIVSTANVREGIEKEVRSLGASDFIAKPYDLEILLEKIRTFLP